jgi:hypothetical protein
MKQNKYVLIFILLLSCTKNDKINNQLQKNTEPKILEYYQFNDEYKMSLGRIFDEDFIVKKTEWKDGKFIVIKNCEIIYELPQSEIRKYFPFAWDSTIIGTSSDNNYVWFECTFDYIICYGLIDIRNGKYLLFDPPEKYMGYQLQINFNNGDVIYSDFPFQGTTTDSERTKKSGKIFYLYKNNFFRKELQIIDENVGNGFIITKENKIEYKKENW